MKILRRDRGHDLKGPNSPYRTERIAYWAWQCARHPLSIPAHLLRHTETFLRPDGSDVSSLWIYGDPDSGLPLYTGVDIPGATIYGDSTALRNLAAVLTLRADHCDRVAAMHDSGRPVTHEDCMPSGAEH
jgi:hypothetical protein